MDSKKIDFYGTKSPNVHKVLLAFEAMNIPFTYHHLDVKKGEQYSADFKRINPNCKLPAIVDHSTPGDLKVFESANILQYLALRYGNGKYLPKPESDIQGYTETLNWVYWQCANLGPCFGQFVHFSKYCTEKIPYAIERYLKELSRLLHVLNDQLQTNKYVAGNEYSIADMAIFPWIKYLKFGMISELSESEFPNVWSYIDRVRSIPSVQKVFDIIEDDQMKNPPNFALSDEERKWLFNQNGRDTCLQ